MVKLAFSYAHKDEALRNELETHLSPLQREGLLTSWHDRKIIPGQDFTKEIDHNFEDAQIILLLVSSDFIASDYCHEIEMRRAIARHEEGSAVVIPVILRPCHWQGLMFGRLQAATRNAKPVTEFQTLDAGFYEVVGAIRRAVEHLGSLSRRDPSPSPGARSSEEDGARPRVSPTTDRSSNLRVKKQFSDLERDQALVECFEYAARFFENSLRELEVRNPHIEGSFRRVDANSFEVTIYDDGRSRARCGIWIEHGHRDASINYNHSGVSPGSYNESMSIADDGYTIGFKPMGMAMRRSADEGLLTMHGVSEYFWDMLIERLQ